MWLCAFLDSRDGFAAESQDLRVSIPDSAIRHSAEAVPSAFLLFPKISLNLSEKYTYNNILVLSRKHFCSGKAIIITYSKFVSVALVIQHVKRMRSFILSSVAVWLCHILHVI